MRAAKVRESLSLLRSLNLGLTKIIDVGIQHFTPPLMEIFPDLPHVLFEPVEEYYPHIRKNYAALSFELVETAVSDFDGELLLHTEKKTRGDEISHSHIVKTPTVSTRTVRSTRLDSYLSPVRKEDNFLLKIDVEGPDVPLAILRGAAGILANTAVVMIEMTVDKFMQRAQFLDEHGFDVWDICDLCYYGDCLWQVDVFFVRRDLKAANIGLRPMHDRPFRSDRWQSGF
jgi:FkbM family methyltransferase